MIYMIKVAGSYSCISHLTTSETNPAEEIQLSIVFSFTFYFLFSLMLSINLFIHAIINLTPSLYHCASLVAVCLQHPFIPLFCIHSFPSFSCPLYLFYIHYSGFLLFIPFSLLPSSLLFFSSLPLRL